ncbi:hypothetical protein GOC06_26285 [Sinorhizobium meliloti]|uniref:hypothetical protein n=1 Tax=Rhizobium meliloti TaxID=382 RepID=UPI00299F3281|nr:hypothetical protein [Sinorhizobium meliloti]MDX0196917.1 hypothetical protein [Sinorhizobium meliloti]MDX0258356.1 hypothetical protein [Sinorhizobium meliloti]MDX0269892.1 hypothetical protein [Sinorhizobium meliloti]
MTNYLSLPAVALCGFVTAFCNLAPLRAHAAETIFVDAVENFTWKANNCTRCTQVGEEGRSLEISVLPGDIIVFRQASDIDHGITHLLTADDEKIRNSGEDGNDTQIVEELTRVGPGKDLLPIPTTTPVEMARIKVKDNFTGSLQLQCTAHFNVMTVTLKKD